MSKPFKNTFIDCSRVFMMEEFFNDYFLLFTCVTQQEVLLLSNFLYY
jgi:hypothetical protein